MSGLYIGLMSGTSMDGIDAALIRFENGALEILQTADYDYPNMLREQLLVARSDTTLRTPADVPELHLRVGEAFRDATNNLLASAGVAAEAVAAIGSHGQTLRHAPDASPPYSLQIGDADVIAAGTGIATIADFRRADIELGGQGAPLAPAFHEWLFRTTGAPRVVLNVGGIANITALPANEDPTTGFDTGPGNTLLDAWAREHLGEPFDRDGAWGATGTVRATLLKDMLADPYFLSAPPKSTGFEYFNLDWIRSFPVAGLNPADVQATLCALSATSIARDVRSHAWDRCDVFVCGGGTQNSDLMRRLREGLPECRVRTTAAAGLDPDWVEAVAFAWLAMRSLEGLPGNLPSVTGATGRAVLGSVHRPH